MDQLNGKAAMRFLTFSNDQEIDEKKEKLKEAAHKIEQAIAREQSLKELVDYIPLVEDETIDPANDTRPLYERLMEQKNKKQEAFDESQKLSNLVTKLDEDDVNYLNEVVKNRQEEEIKKRLKIYDVMEEKKRIDEKRILDEEKKMKSSLIGSSKNDRKSTSSVKSKLSSLIKIKPKSKITNAGASNHNTDQLFDMDQQNKDSPKPIVQSSSNDNLINETQSKKRKTEQSPTKESSDDSQKGVGLNNTCEKEQVSEKQCSCPDKDLMKCIGVLPSLTIIRKLPDSSDTDYSDDDLEARIVPRVGRRK